MTKRTNIHLLPQYLPYSDAMRVFAMLAVVALHSSAEGVMRHGVISSTNWWIFNGIDSLCRWAVPVFVMLSGALLLDPARQESLRMFYKKRMKRVLIPLFVWAPVYFLWTRYFYGEAVDTTFIIKALASGLRYNHLYFLFIIIGLYVATPALRLLMRHSHHYVPWLLASGMFFLTATDILFEYVCMNALTRFIPYMSFFIAGSLLYNIKATRMHFCIALILFVTASLTVIIETEYLVTQWGINDYRAMQYYSHFHPAVVVQSLAMFIMLIFLFSSKSDTSLAKLIKAVSPAMFGVYLVHIILLTILRSYTHTLFNNYALAGVGIEVALTYILSTILCLGMLRVPFARHAIGA